MAGAPSKSDLIAFLRIVILLGTQLLDRLLHHGHVLKRGPSNWRTNVQTDMRTEEAAK